MTDDLDPTALDPGIIDRWRVLLKDADAALTYYFEHILPWVVDRLESIPAHAAMRAQGCSLLVSTMGFSPETHGNRYVGTSPRATCCDC